MEAEHRESDIERTWVGSWRSQTMVEKWWWIIRDWASGIYVVNIYNICFSEAMQRFPNYGVLRCLIDPQTDFHWLYLCRDSPT